MTAAELTLRRDLVFSRQETDEGVVFVVKEPNSGRFFRIGEVEHFVARQFDGATPLDTVRQRVENVLKRIEPVTMDLEDMMRRRAAGEMF